MLSLIWCLQRFLPVMPTTHRIKYWNFTIPHFPMPGKVIQITTDHLPLKEYSIHSGLTQDILSATSPTPQTNIGNIIQGTMTNPDKTTKNLKITQNQSNSLNFSQSCFSTAMFSKRQNSQNHSNSFKLTSKSLEFSQTRFSHTFGNWPQGDLIHTSFDDLWITSSFSPGFSAPGRSRVYELNFRNAFTKFPYISINFMNIFTEST